MAERTDFVAIEPIPALKTMARISTLTTILMVALTYFVTCKNSLVAQPQPPTAWQDEALPRLQSIYDRNEFRPVSFQASWLPDSSGFTVQQLDPETNQPAFWRYDVPSGDRTKIEQPINEQSDQNRTSPDGTHRLEFREGNLFSLNLANNQRAQLTRHDAGRDVSYRNPLWSPDGQRIVFLESDSTEVRRRSVLVPSDPSYPGVREDVFARVGEKLANLRIGVVDKHGKKVQWLPIQPPEEGFYLRQVEWAGNSDEVLAEVLSRFRDQRQLLLVSTDGSIKVIFEETNDAWAVGSHEINSGLEWIQDGDAFIVISEKDGWRHAYLCSRDGKQETRLTVGNYDIIDRAVIDEEGGWYYFYASPENGTQKYLHRVPLDGSGTLERMTPVEQPGTHDYDFSPDSRYAIHTYSTLNSPPVLELVQLPEHRVIRVLEDNSELRERAKQVISHPTEFLQIDIGDGVVMDASLTKPKDFDDTKKYPVFVYVYGEPYLQTVLDRWGAAQIEFHRVVADMGYLVVSIDNRGTACPKGAAWRRSIFGSLGPLSTEDQAAALKELARMRSYVDLSRVGIWGWSGGGSNTLNAMFRKPDLYHVGIAVVPKPQPWLYNAWFQEIYMRTREVNAEGYEQSAPINFAEGLKGRLLMITGSGETNTHIQIIEGLVDRLIELGKQFDYMVYPNRDHGLREGAGTVVHVRMLILRYLIEHLPPGPQ